MSENTTPVTELTSHYVNQVAGDLEQNVKEQERLAAEIGSLQQQLATLQQDHTILVSMQQALGAVASVTTATEPAGPVVPAPRKKSSAESVKRRAGKTSSTAEQAGTTRKASAKKAAPKPAARSAAKPAKKTAAKTAQPTLVELVRAHLADQSEPRSAAEVTEALGRAHPDREIQTKVVRTTLENLVARTGAQRTKQGSSVFYTISGPQEPATGDEKPAEPAVAG
ncbi:hypothetical protein ACF08B_24860 [Streptomyces sp. NPDC015139]|uniref:hypothetical protein n=1 Tax=Streptomyces sp. NPDC015139 TaxID=3364942 RepID=UPI0036FE5DB3